jgi:diguanylate cyclase (GGDEF)-like protein
LGGDEFGVILPHTDAAAAPLVRDRILHAIAQTPVRIGPQQITLGLRIGFASLPDHATDSESLMAAADSAMYLVKQASRSQQVLAS